MKTAIAVAEEAGNKVDSNLQQSVAKVISLAQLDDESKLTLIFKSLLIEESNLDKITAMIDTKVKENIDLNAALKNSATIFFGLQTLKKDKTNVDYKFMLEVAGITKNLLLEYIVEQKKSKNTAEELATEIQTIHKTISNYIIAASKITPSPNIAQIDLYRQGLTLCVRGSQLMDRYKEMSEGDGQAMALVKTQEDNFCYHDLLLHEETGKTYIELANIALTIEESLSYKTRAIVYCKTAYDSLISYQGSIKNLLFYVSDYNKKCVDLSLSIKLLYTQIIAGTQNIAQKQLVNAEFQEFIRNEENCNYFVIGTRSNGNANTQDMHRLIAEGKIDEAKKICIQLITGLEKEQEEKLSIVVRDKDIFKSFEANCMVLLSLHDKISSKELKLNPHNIKQLLKFFGEMLVDIRALPIDTATTIPKETGERVVVTMVGQKLDVLIASLLKTAQAAMDDDISTQTTNRSVAKILQRNDLLLTRASLYCVVDLLPLCYRLSKSTIEADSAIQTINRFFAAELQQGKKLDGMNGLLNLVFIKIAETETKLSAIGWQAKVVYSTNTTTKIKEEVVSAINEAEKAYEQIKQECLLEEQQSQREYQARIKRVKDRNRERMKDRWKKRQAAQEEANIASAASNIVVYVPGPGEILYLNAGAILRAAIGNPDYNTAILQYNEAEQLYLQAKSEAELYRNHHIVAASILEMASCWNFRATSMITGVTSGNNTQIVSLHNALNGYNQALSLAQEALNYFDLYIGQQDLQDITQLNLMTQLSQAIHFQIQNISNTLADTQNYLAEQERILGNNNAKLYQQRMQAIARIGAENFFSYQPKDKVSAEALQYRENKEALKNTRYCQQTINNFATSNLTPIANDYKYLHGEGPILIPMLQADGSSSLLAITDGGEQQQNSSFASRVRNLSQTKQALMQSLVAIATPYVNIGQPLESAAIAQVTGHFQNMVINNAPQEISM